MKYIVLFLALGAVVWAGCNDGERMIVTLDWEFGDVRSALETAGIKDMQELPLIAGFVCKLTEKQKTLLADLLPVRYIEPDYEVSIVDATVEAQDVGLSAEVVDWGAKYIHAPECWRSATGAGVRIGVIDTGIKSDHPDLTDRVVGGYNAINGGSYEDDNNHGTYIATVIAAQPNGVGIIGVAPNAALYAIKVLNKDGRGYSSDVVKGYQWALEQEVDLVNLSLGSPRESQAMRDAMLIAAFQGMGTVAAAGNSGEGRVMYPAANDVAICVGAVGYDGTRMSWSNYGDALKANGVMAPGYQVLAGNKSGGWSRVSGTSLATPYVTGTLALMVSMKWCTRDLLFRGASRYETPDRYYGYGVIDAREALDAVIEASEDND